MSRYHLSFLFVFLPTLIFGQTRKQNITLVIHGGAGTIKKENMTDELDKQYREKLSEALKAGYEVLSSGGTSKDAIVAAIMIMEDSPLFNAGKGAVFANNEKNELDASFMDGETLNAGAVTGVTNVKNPVLAARAVMENSEHVMLAREGAEKFAKEQGIELVDPSYFFTERRKKALERAKQMDEAKGDLGNEEEAGNYKHGTVGAVAVDEFGNLAAATSTGGMTNKKWARIGDSPIIGAGTYANNATCAVSSTGHGEYFIRGVVAYDISALMEYKQLTLKKAAKRVIMKKLSELGGTGGIVAVDADGNVAMPFNTDGMYRGYVKADGEPVVMIYGDEK